MNIFVLVWKWLLQLFAGIFNCRFYKPNCKVVKIYSCIYNPFLADCYSCICSEKWNSCLVLFFILYSTCLHFCTEKIVIGISILVLLFTMAWASLQFIPSLENKFGYFKYELQMIRNNEIKAEHSDAQRLVSMQLGTEIIRQHWLAGVGAGDIKTAMKAQYDLKYPNKDFAIMTPHNQFIYVWVCTGIFGLLIFITAFFILFFSSV